MNKILNYLFTSVCILDVNFLSYVSCALEFHTARLIISKKICMSLGRGI